MSVIWNRPIFFENTIFDRINDSMSNFTNNFNKVIPNLVDAKNLMCFSDYSGEEKEANYYTYSFLIINGDNITEWDKNRTILRKNILSDNRRISYKNYRDKLSQRYIDKYVKLSDSLPGYLLIFAFDKKKDSIFSGDTPINIENPQFKNYRNWTKDTLEKTFRILHLLSFFVAGLSHESQNLIWITDNDKIVANKDRLIQLTDLFSFVLTSYLKHNLGHIRVGTTQSDDGSRLIEDLCAIPDLAAGAYSDQLKTTKEIFGEVIDKVFWMSSPDFKTKTADLTWWLASSQKNLCRLCFKIDNNENGNSNIGFYHFYDRK
ncbi:MAG: hypothetical protein COC06_11175 [Bacteroidales bacterium]|nr:MAG: hypothetical protein COC06_11175 [Bacteroidales bacterium]